MAMNRTLAASIAALLAAAGSAHATDYLWIGGDSGFERSWNRTANWVELPGLIPAANVPGAGDAVFIPDVIAANRPIIDVGSPVVIDALIIDTPTTNVGTPMLTVPSGESLKVQTAADADLYVPVDAIVLVDGTGVFAVDPTYSPATHDFGGAIVLDDAGSTLRIDDSVAFAPDGADVGLVHGNNVAAIVEVAASEQFGMQIPFSGSFAIDGNVLLTSNSAVTAIALVGAPGLTIDTCALDIQSQNGLYIDTGVDLTVDQNGDLVFSTAYTSAGHTVDGQIVLTDASAQIYVDAATVLAGSGRVFANDNLAEVRIDATTLTLQAEMRGAMTIRATSSGTLSNQGLVVADAGDLTLHSSLTLSDTSGAQRWQADNGGELQFNSAASLAASFRKGNSGSGGAFYFDQAVSTTASFINGATGLNFNNGCTGTNITRGASGSFNWGGFGNTQCP